MTIKYVSGDLFTNRYNAQASTHGGNCKGALSVVEDNGDNLKS